MSPLFLDNEGAQSRALQQANSELQAKLNEAIEVVPCPTCGWIQANMLPLARSQFLRRVKMAGVILLGSLVIPLLFLFQALNRPPEEEFPARLVLETSVMALAQLVGGASLLIWRRLACEQYDPNATDLEARLKAGRARAVLRDEPGPPESSGVDQ